MRAYTHARTRTCAHTLTLNLTHTQPYTHSQVLLALAGKSSLSPAARAALSSREQARLLEVAKDCVARDLGTWLHFCQLMQLVQLAGQGPVSSALAHSHWPPHLRSSTHRCVSARPRCWPRR